MTAMRRHPRDVSLAQVTEQVVMSQDSTLGSGWGMRDDSDPHLLLGIQGPFDSRTLGRVCDGGKCRQENERQPKTCPGNCPTRSLFMPSPWSVTGQKTRVNLRGT